jgi:DNA modification methylase
MSRTPKIKIRDRTRELRRVPASELIPNLKNWRRHPDKQKKAMRAVLQEIGYADALLAREDESGQLILIDGHLRADVTPTQDVPVLILDVTAAEADKILATLDPLASMAELDTDAWTALIDGIDSDLPEFRDLLAELNPQTDVFRGLTDEDAIPEPPTQPISVRGDVWLLGKHRLACGDSTNLDDVQRVLNGVLPSLMVTDPPYGVQYAPEWRNKALGEANRSVGTVANDHEADWASAYSLFPGDIIYVWHAGNKADIVAHSLHCCNFEIRAQLIWVKQHFVISRGHYHGQHEPCWYAVRKGSTANWRGDRKQSTVWQINNGLSQGGARKPEDTRTGHGTQKPVECMRRPIVNHINSGQAVYDPFVGSGTTIIAAETTGRVCTALDIDPIYVDVAVERWQAFTGQAATLESDRTTFDETAKLRRTQSQSKAGGLL